MTMLEKHAAALSGPNPLYHEFLGRYRRNAKCVHGFVEGKEDPSFYRGPIESVLPTGWRVELWPAKGKDAVIELHGRFDWRRFERTQVVFFMDRDLSGFLDERLLEDEANVFVTANYSIENDIVTRDTCDRVLTEICGLDPLPRDEMDAILDLFEQQLEVFQDHLVSVMAWVIHWRRNDWKPCLNDICMKHLFSIKSGVLRKTPRPKDHPDWCSYIHGQCNIKLSNDDISDVEREFRDADGPRRFIRGKYELWFLVEFCLSVRAGIGSLSATVTAPPKMKTSMGHQDAVVLVAPRARIPESLKVFLHTTCGKYVSSMLEAGSSRSPFRGPPP